MTEAPSETPAAAPRRAWHGWLPWLPLILGTVLALSYLEWARAHVLILLDHAAFGNQTMVYSGGKRDRKDVAQCGGADDSAKCVNSWVRAGKPPVVLWFGNSQLMGINRAKPGDVNAPGWLRAALQPRGYRLVTYAEPNVNLTEQSIIFDAVAPVYNPKLLILPVCFDDIREIQVREDIAAFMPDQAPAQAAETDAPKAAEPGKVATNATVQARFEESTTDWLEKHWRLWKARRGLRGTTAFAIHAMRNQLLGIHSTSKRPVDPGLFRQRMALLEQIVTKARARGMDVLLYVPPYRRDMDGPYVEDQYQRFKAEMKAIAARRGARFADLEPLVPGPEWATVVDDLFGFQEPDFMHFTEIGHRRLAAAVDQQIHAMGY